MAEPRSLGDMIAFAASQKLAAADARRNPDPTAEKPRDAIFDGLHIVRAAIAGDGYTFSNSGPKFVRKSGDLTFQIRIQSDRNNAAGQRAAVWVHASVCSRAFTAWSKKHSSEWIRPNAPFPLPVFATQLGYLSEQAGWMEWDFNDKFQRSVVAADLVEMIRAGAYPLFSAFEAGNEDIAHLVDRDWPSPEGVLSYLLATGDPDLASVALRRFLDQRPNLRREYDLFKREFEKQGVPKYRTGGAHDLAAFVVATSYQWGP